MNARPALAEFDSGHALVEAALALREAGALNLDAYTPYPVHGLEEAVDLPPSRLPWFCLFVGLSAGLGAYLLQWWLSVDYPLNAGSRPRHAPLAFVPITFEMTILFASFAAWGFLLWKSGLPRLYHPVFDVDGFERASIDRFWLSFEAPGTPEERARTTEVLARHHALRIVWPEGQ